MWSESIVASETSTSILFIHKYYGGRNESIPKKMCPYYGINSYNKDMHYKYVLMAQQPHFIHLIPV